MKRSERLSQSAFRHLLGTIIAIGLTLTEAIFGTANLLSSHYFSGFILAILTCATGLAAMMLHIEAWRLWTVSSREAEIERRASIRPRLFNN